MSDLVIAVDGPSASGKSTVCDVLAKKLNINHLSSGALYRAVTLYVLEHNIDLNLFSANKNKEILEILNNIKIEVEFENFVQKIYLNNVDVTNELNTNIISNNACIISQNALVREFIKQIQCSLSKKGGIIIDGRDITSVVLKDCENRFFVTASLEARAQRRYLQYNKQIPLSKIVEDLKMRDEQDQTRKLNPLKIVSGVKIIDNSNLTIEQTCEEIIKNLK
ncbi:MAG: (d)CMP kinase [Christensenellales bacterium]